MGALAGYAFAQAPTPNPVPFGPGGMMGGRGMRGGMMGGQGGYGARGGMMQNGEFGPMHEYMEAAMAKALGMDVEDLEAAIDSGKTMWDVAQEKGISQDEFFTLMQTARGEALKQMVADGVITQAQADWMLQRGPGGMGGGRGGRGGSGCPMNGGGRFAPQTTPATPNTNS
jgi:uncharacterized protein YidB (DUF937 family)